MTKKIILTRFKEIEDGTIGRLSAIDQNGIEMFFCYTLEPAGDDTTQRGQDKRIPIGSYGITMRFSPKFQRELPLLFNKDVPKDRYILIHHGNYPKDTEGCILVGKTWDKEGVYHSKDTLERLLRCIKEENLKQIDIEEDYE